MQIQGATSPLRGAYSFRLLLEPIYIDYRVRGSNRRVAGTRRSRNVPFFLSLVISLDRSSNRCYLTGGFEHRSRRSKEYRRMRKEDRRLETVAFLHLLLEILRFTRCITYRRRFFHSVDAWPRATPRETILFEIQREGRPFARRSTSVLFSLRARIALEFSWRV